MLRNQAERHLVLIGGGHTHVQVLRRFAMEPPPATRLVVVVDTPIAVYSGMVPGFAAGQYRAAELEIDVLPLARRARAQLLVGRALAVDTEKRHIVVEGRPPVRYDVASFDIGSIVAGRELPGVRQHALPTRPIGRFVERLDAFLAATAAEQRAAGPLRLLVVGAGAGGVELAFALHHRLGGEAGRVHVTLVQSEARILEGSPADLAARVHRAAQAAGIEVRCGERVVAVAEKSAELTDGRRLACDAVVWVTGAVSQPLFRDSGLATDERGFVLTRSTLQVVGHDELFAAGDCATLEAHPRTPKAGVYAVRQGPVLIDNLRAFLGGGRLRSYVPQRDFLSLLNLGDGRAIGSKRGLSFEGRWVMQLKDRIDRRFMRKFQVLEADGALTPEFRALPAMDGAPMLCGGCAAKVGQSVLQRALARLEPPPADPSVALGLAAPDDAAAFTTPGGDVVATTLDAFRAFVDDPYLVGRVAAVNAVSDLLAKGATPRHALVLVALPQDLAEAESEEMLYLVLAGARAALDPLGVSIVGGHSTTAAELLVGFAVDGEVGSRTDLLTLGALRPGQSLVLTKPLGTGVLFHADMQGRARGPWITSALASMLRPNATAARIARDAGATAVTDVTGFGLAGHLGEMLRQSGVAAIVDVAALPALPGVVELLGQGLRSTFHPENAKARRALAVHPERARHPRFDLLFDPQTSGGLLFGVAPEAAARTLEALHQAGDDGAAIIGRVTPARADGALFEVVSSAGDPAANRAPGA